jgi:two-component system, sensor histidine kinase and response regulator
MTSTHRMRQSGSPKVSFLLVGACEDNLTTLEAMLHRDDLELHKARSGDEALECVREHDFALALLETRMPDVDGCALAERMRGTTRAQALPIMFVAADEHERRRASDGRDVGAVDFLVRPIDPRCLRYKVEAFVALSQQRQLLAETRRFHEMLMASVSHDLRNPLNVMMMAAQGIDLSTREPGTHVLAQKIYANGRRVARMIDDLSDLARGRPGNGIPLACRRFDFGALLRRVVDAHVAMCPNRRISLAERTCLSGEWDEARIEQLIDNLVANALRHGEPAEPVVVDVHDDTGFVVVSVHNGGAIEEDLLPHLFDPFGAIGKHRAESLGLFVAHRIVSAHGGSIGVQSDEARGTTFEVRLPREYAAHA